MGVGLGSSSSPWGVVSRLVCSGRIQPIPCSMRDKEQQQGWKLLPAAGKIPAATRKALAKPRLPLPISSPSPCVLQHPHVALPATSSFPPSPLWEEEEEGAQGRGRPLPPQSLWMGFLLASHCLRSLSKSWDHTLGPHLHPPPAAPRAGALLGFPPIVVAPASPLPVSPPCDPCPHPNIPFAFFIFIFFPLFCFLCVRLRHSRPSSSSKTIVRGSKASKDGSLTWLLDEFENMSVSRSNSLRRDSPPFPPRRHQLHQENGLSQGLTSAPAQEDAGRSRKSRPGAGHEVEQGKERPRHKEEHHGQHQSQQCPAPKAAPGGRPPPDYPKAPLERDSKQERVLRRERPEAAEKRPKSTLGAGGSSPPSPRDKRPLSGPSIRTPNIPISEGVMKTAQQTGRAFNTYPRAETDPGPQVTCPPAPRGCSSSSSSNCSSSSSCLKPIKKASPRCWASSG